MKRLERLLCAALAAHLATGARPRVPEPGVLLWGAFAGLSATRHGIEPIRPEAVAAWVALYRVPLQPRHVDVIRALDRVWLDNARDAAAGKPVGPLPELTGAAFDAAFSALP